MPSLIFASSVALAPQAFQQHCFDCHGGNALEGGLAHDMAPDDWDRPSNDECDAMPSWVDHRTRQLADEAVRLEPRIDDVRNDVIEVNEVGSASGEFERRGRDDDRRLLHDHEHRRVGGPKMKHE